MSENKQTVQSYMQAFNKTNHADILSCLTDDVEWVIPGIFHIKGKDAFDKEIENDAFVGRPTITVTRLTEERDVVIAEGSVRCAKREGGFLNAVFCDVFVMQDAKIKHLTSYLMEVKSRGCIAHHCRQDMLGELTTRNLQARGDISRRSASSKRPFV